MRHHFQPLFTVIARYEVPKQSRGGGETLRLPRPDKSGLAMTSVVVSDWKRDGGGGGKVESPDIGEFGGLGVSPRFRSPPRLGDIGVD